VVWLAIKVKGGLGGGWS